MAVKIDCSPRPVWRRSRTWHPTAGPPSAGVLAGPLTSRRGGAG